MSQQHWDEHTGCAGQCETATEHPLDAGILDPMGSVFTEILPAVRDDLLGEAAGSYGTGYGDPLGDEPHIQTFTEPSLCFLCRTMCWPCRCAPPALSPPRPHTGLDNLLPQMNGISRCDAAPSWCVCARLVLAPCLLSVWPCDPLTETRRIVTVNLCPGLQPPAQQHSCPCSELQLFPHQPLLSATSVAEPAMFHRSKRCRPGTRLCWEARDSMLAMRINTTLHNRNSKQMEDKKAIIKTMKNTLVKSNTPSAN